MSNILHARMTLNRLRGLQALAVDGLRDVPFGKGSPRNNLLRLGWIEPAYRKGDVTISESALKLDFGPEPGWGVRASQAGWVPDGTVMTEEGWEWLDRAHQAESER